MAYASTAELGAWLGPSTVAINQSAELTIALNGAEAIVDQWCGRTFNDAGSASERKFYADSCYFVDVNDFSTTSGLVVKTDDDDDGTAETTWASTDYVLEPENNLRNGATWPYCRIRAVEGRTFPIHRSGRPGVYVTARWGWAAVPAAVKSATLLIAAADFQRRDSPHGVAGFGEFGVVRVRGTMDPRAAELLAPYRKGSTAAGIAG